MCRFFLTLTIGAALAAAFALDPEAYAPACSSVSRRCSAASEQRSATEYCSSLHLKDATSTVSRGTISVEPTCTPITHTKSPVPTESSYIGFSSGPFKRDAEATHPTVPAPAPSCFGTTSRARSCGCLSLTTSTTTTTVARATVTGPFKMEEYRRFVYHQFAAVTHQDHGQGDQVYVVWPQKNYLAGAENFFLDPLGHLRYAALPGLIASEQPGANDTGVFLSNATSGIPKPRCSINTPTCELVCTLAGQSNQYVCDGATHQWFIRKNAPKQFEYCASFAPVVQTISPKT